jgi:signal transduction histidine kinase
MGIGLSICKSIVEAHGGRIATRNLPRCGAVFSFTLPSSPQGPAAYTSSS